MELLICFLTCCRAKEGEVKLKQTTLTKPLKTKATAGRTRTKSPVMAPVTPSVVVRFMAYAIVDDFVGGA
jgi:hypothetical protein